MAQRKRKKAFKAKKKSFALGTPPASPDNKFKNSFKQINDQNENKASNISKSQSKEKQNRIEVTTPTGAINTKSTKYDYKIGDYVKLKDRRRGHIRFVGQTAFSKHILYGIQLDHKYNGKHNGTVKNVKYFSAPANRGIFVSISKIDCFVNNKLSRKSSKKVANLSPKSANKLQQTSSKHGRKLSALIYRNTNTHFSKNKSRISFIVPDIFALSASLSQESETERSENSEMCMPKFSDLIKEYSQEMMDDFEEEKDEKLNKKSKLKKHQIRLTPVHLFENDGKKMRKSKLRKKAISVRIPFGVINSKCMSLILSFLTMNELSTYAFVSKSAHDSIRLVARYDFRYMLYDALSIQQVRKILCILKFHKPKELILPMAYFIYDPVVLRLFLQFFNVDHEMPKKHLFKYVRKLVIDDRDIRPNSWLMRPGNYPWNELCDNNDYGKETIFPFELVECFNSLAHHLWELDIRYTANIELSYFLNSASSILFLSVSAENRMDMESFENVTHLTLQNKIRTWEEIERSELFEWKHHFIHLTHLKIINQRFECSLISLLCAISHLPQIQSYFQSFCHFNEPTDFSQIEHMKKKTNLSNKLVEMTISKQTLNDTFFTIYSQFFSRINYLKLIDCKLKSKVYDFSFLKEFPMTYLTQIQIVNLKPKQRLSKNEKYCDWLQSVFDKITKYVSNTPVIVECTLIRSKVRFFSHVQCKLCKQLVDKRRMNDHLDTMCPQKAIQCPLCPAKVKRCKLSYHWDKNCREYYLQCFLCPKVFNVRTKQQINDHVLRHSMNLDEESGKYELVFIGHPQAMELANEYPVYSITICQTCQRRLIAPVVSKKFRKDLAQNECESCIDLHMNERKRKWVLPHPYPKEVKLKPPPN